MRDDWGADPSVRAMRGVFRAVEEAQAELLAGAGVDRWDPRLRGWRTDALWRFEKAWPAVARAGLAGGEAGAARLYCHCLAAVMAADGAAAGPWRPEPDLADLLKEVWR